ncbi:MAG: NADPH-dependent F420 reductase [Pseudomonadales bacterium]
MSLFRLLLIALLFLNGCASTMANNAITVAVIGTGDMGDSLGPQLSRNGYQVIYGSRDPHRDSVQKLVKASVGARATSPLEAAQQAEIVLLVVPWPAMETVAQKLGKLENKIVIDASIPYRMAEDGYLESSVSTSSSELIQQWNTQAHVVKVGFPGSFLIDQPELMGEAPSALIAGDNKLAKERVARLIDDIGMTPLDAGPLRHARHIESMGLLYMVPLLQGRDQGWEFFIRENSYWPCTLAGGQLYGANANSPDKAVLPNVVKPETDCRPAQKP